MGYIRLRRGAIFLTKIGNFSNQVVTLTPGMVVGQAERHLENTVFNVENKEIEDKKVDWRQVLDLEGLSKVQKEEVTRVFGQLCAFMGS